MATIYRQVDRRFIVVSFQEGEGEFGGVEDLVDKFGYRFLYFYCAHLISRTLSWG